MACKNPFGRSPMGTHTHFQGGFARRYPSKPLPQKYRHLHDKALPSHLIKALTCNSVNAKHWAIRHWTFNIGAYILRLCKRENLPLSRRVQKPWHYASHGAFKSSPALLKRHMLLFSYDAVVSCALDCLVRAHPSSTSSVTIRLATSKWSMNKDRASGRCDRTTQ